MKPFRIAAAIAAALFLAACVTTKTPIGTTVGFVRDPALIGVWRSTEKEARFIIFTKGSNGAMTAAVPDDDGFLIFNVKIARLSDRAFMNAQLTQFDGEVPDRQFANRYFPELYAVRGDMLTTFELDEKKTKDAIRAGSIEGTVGSGNFGTVQITASGPALDKFMQSPAGLALFEHDATVYRRIK